MGIILRAFFATLILYLVYGLYVSNYNFTGVSETSIAHKHPLGFFDYRGAINIHSKKSSGSGTIDEIAVAAQNAKLDFIIITDFAAFPPDKTSEGYRDNLLLLNDGEYSFLDSRLLFLNISDNERLQVPGQIQTMLGDLLGSAERFNSESFFILSHPLKPGYSWNGPYPPGLNGIEVINLRHVWESGWRNNRGEFLFSLLMSPFNSQLSFLRLIGDLSDEQNLWNQLTRLRPTFGSVGTDAEAKFKITNNYHLKFPSYETLFSIASNHVLLKSELTGNFLSDKTKLISAIKAGQFYFSFDMLGSPEGFSIGLVDASGEYHMMGARIEFKSNQYLELKLPEITTTNNRLHDFETIIIKDGKPIFTSKESTIRYLIDSPGVYRAVVRVIPRLPIPDGRSWLPWILSNPFYIR